MNRRKELEAMNGLQLMDLIEKYKLDSKCKRKEAIERILEHEGQPLKETRPPRNFAQTKLKAARLAAGLTQAKLSELTGINAGTLKHYEQGSKPFDGAKFGTIIKTALVLNCSVGDLIENEEVIDLFEEYMNRA